MPWGGAYTGKSSPARPRAGGWGSKFQPAPVLASDAEKKHGGGGVGGFFSRLGSDLVNVAEHAPGGIAKIGEATYAQAVHGEGSPFHHKGDPNSPLLDVAEGTGKQIKSDLTHPLRHPGYTLLDLLPVANTGAKVAEAGRVASAGGDAADVVRAATRRPVYPARTLTRGGLEVKVGSSQSALGALAQRASDAIIQGRAAAKPGGAADRLLVRKMGKAVTAEAGVIQNVHKASGASLIAMGRKLSPAEQKALQVVAEEAPLEGRITASSARVTGAKTAKLRRNHQAELDLLHQAKPLLDENTAGKPAFAAEHAPKLDKVLAAMRDVAGSREELLQHLGQLTSEAVQGRKSKAARVALGQPLEEGTLRLDAAGNPVGIEHAHTDILHARLNQLDGDYQKLVDGAMGAKPGDYKATTAIQNARNAKAAKAGRPAQYSTISKQLRDQAEKGIADTMRRNPDHPIVKAWEKKLAEGEAIRAELTRRGDVSIGLEKPREIPAAEPLFEASPDAVRIPDVATRRGVRSLGRAGGVGSSGSVGHLRQLGSTTHEYSGALRENAVRREDTTALVGESSMEAAKYAGLKHVHELVREAVTPAPLRESDVAVRLDNLKSHERMPLEVRRFLDNPDEFFKSATPAEQATAFEGLRSRLFINPKTLDAHAAAEFQQLEQHGKIGWVPKGLLGDLAKPHIPLSNPAVKGVDAINNASRFAILYLKPAYALPNLLGNAALTVLQQGFAAVPNLARAARLNSVLGAPLVARIDALMGEGFARAISSHGQGLGSAVVDKAASVWSKGVDTPFRRSSFLYEAKRLGYQTEAELEQLLTDPEHLQQLVEVSQRANRELIDYANLTPTEREVIRRVVFFYPWVKGSTVYAGRLLREHPVKSAVIAQTGAIGAKNDPAAPSYLNGAFDVGGRLVNPTSAAILQTPAQVGQALVGLAGGDVGQVGELANFASPATALALAAVTRRDRSGYSYSKGENLGGIAFDQLVKQLPQYTLGQRISDALNGKGADRLYPPNVRDALLQYIVGGIAPRKYNKAKLAELAATEKQPHYRP